MIPPPSGYPSAPPGPTFDEAPSTPPSGTSMDNNHKDGPLAPSMAPPPGRSAAPPPVGIVRLQGKKGLLTVATGIILFVFAMTAGTAIATSNRMDDLSCKEKDCNTIPVSYFGAWYKPSGDIVNEPEWKYVFPAAVLVHFWIFALSDFPSALVAIFVLANIALFRRALFYFIALIVLAICFLVFLVALIVVTATTLSATATPEMVMNERLSRLDLTINELLAGDCCKPGTFVPERYLKEHNLSPVPPEDQPDLCTGPTEIEYRRSFGDYCKTRQSWEITAIVLMWLFGLVSALLRAGYLFLLFLAWKKQRNNDGNSVR